MSPATMCSPKPSSPYASSLGIHTSQRAPSTISVSASPVPAMADSAESESGSPRLRELSKVVQRRFPSTFFATRPT